MAKHINIIAYKIVCTSYLKIPPETPGWRMTTLETAPVAERMQTARGPLWKNDNILLTTSWKCPKPEFSVESKHSCYQSKTNIKNMNNCFTKSRIYYLPSTHSHHMRCEASPSCFCNKPTCNKWKFQTWEIDQNESFNNMTM